MTYWVLKSYSPSDAAYLSDVSSKMPKAQKFRKGISLVDEYPPIEDCKIYYDPQYPDGTQLYGFMDNINNFLIVNSDVRKIFDKAGATDIEYLPVLLCGFKSEVTSEDYAICNVLQSVDIIDMDKSKYRMNSLVEGQIGYLEEMVVNYDAIPDDAKVFRASKMLDRIFIRDDVKEALEDADIEGFDVVEADDWDGL